MKTIHLHGILAEKFGESHQFEVGSAGEALVALSSQLEGFVEIFSPNYWELISGPIRYDTENLMFSIGDVLHIYPAAVGAKKGVAKLILGVGMLALAFSTGGTSLIAQAAGASGAGVGGLSAGFSMQGMILGGALKTFGLSAMIGGVAQLLSPKPKIPSSVAEDKHPSMLFTGAIQTTQEGAAHPIALGGPVMCGSHVVSGGLYVEELHITPTGDVNSNQEDAGSVKVVTTLSNAIHLTNAEITGSKGKGAKSARVAVEAKNTLMTEMTAKLVDLVSVGEVYGWDDPEHPLRCYFMDETAIERDNGSGGNYANFEGLEVHSRLGLPTQDALPGMDEQTSESSVGVVVHYGSANKVVRNITDTTLDAVRIKLSFNSMTEQNTTNGDMNGSRVTYRVGVRANGWADFEWRITRTLAEKFTSPLQIAQRIELPVGQGPWEVAVERLTPDATSVAVSNEFSFLSYTRIIDAKMTYPGSAVVGTVASARQFGDRVPNRAFLWRGIICSIPSNYDPATRKYNGIWDGTWVRKWTNNGVWVTWEVLTNKDWGFGNDIPESLLNKWAFYECAVVCDQPVPNGLGGFEPRWTMAAWINTVEEARTFIQSLCSNYLGVMMWGRGAAQISTDCRKKPIRVVNNSNVMDGKFVYEGVGRKAVYTVALVTWNDPDNFFKPAIETVEIPELIALYGRRTKDVFAFGTTSRGQARRQGLWEVYRDYYGNPFVTYKAGLDHAQVLPGQVVEIADVNDQGIRMGGRLRETSLGSVVLDSAFTFTPGASYVLSISLPEPILEKPSYIRSISSVGSDYVDLSMALDVDDSWAGVLTQGVTTKTIQQVDGGRVYLSSVSGLSVGLVSITFTNSSGGFIETQVKEYTVVNPGISTDTISLTPAQTMPSSSDEWSLVYALRSDDIELQKFSVLSFEETEDDVYEIVALKYNPEIFDLIEDGKTFSPRPTTLYDTTVPALEPSNLDTNYRLVMKGGVAREVVEFSFDKSETELVSKYEIMWRYQYGTWETVTTQNNSYEADYRGAGFYEWTVSTVPSYGKSSPLAYTSKTITASRPIDLVPIINLRLSGQDPSVVTFGGRVLKVEWDVGTPAGYTDSAWLDPFFRDFQVQILKTDNTLLKSYYTTDRRFEYSAEMLAEDLGGAPMLRSLKIQIRLRDQFNTVHPASVKTFTNPAPAIPTINIQTSITGAVISYLHPDDIDVTDFVIWYQALPGVVPDTSPEIRSSQSSVEITTDPMATRYFKFALLDSWSASPLDSNISTERTFTANTISLSSIDTTAPAVPTGLTLTSALTLDTDGTQKIKLTANWNDNVEADLSSYDLQIQEASGNFIGFDVTNSVWEAYVKANTSYVAKVAALDRISNKSAYTATVSHTTLRDTAAPSAPTAVSATAAIQTGWLAWTNATAADLSEVEVWENTANDSSTAIRIATVNALPSTVGGYTRSGLPTGAVRYYWLKSVDTSGNRSGFSSVVTMTMASVTNSDIVAGSITGDRVQANTLAGDRFITNTSLPGTITVGLTGVSIGTIQSQADDPAARVNAKTTTIDPGKILISGSTTLSNWRNGTDSTKIEGGSIYANTINANSLKIGSRGLSITGLEFSTSVSINSLSWTAGTFAYTNDAGVSTTVSVSSGTTGAAASATYVYWVQGASTLSFTTTWATANAANNVVLATYSGGANYAATYGGTIIDGTRIVTQSITASQISGGTITSTQIASQTITARNLLIGSMDNLIMNGSIESGDLLSFSRSTIPAGSSITTPTSTGWPSKYALLLTRGATTGELSIVLSPTSFDDTTMAGGIVSNLNDEFYFECVVYQSSVSNLAVDAFVRTGPSTVVSLTPTAVTNSGVVGSALVANSTTTSFSKIVGTFKNVSGYGKVYFRVLNANTANTAFVYVWNVLARRTNNVTMIQDGSIVTSKIQASAITTTELATNSVTSVKITAGAITAEKLSIGSANNLLTGTGVSNHPINWLVGNGTSVINTSGTTFYGPGTDPTKNASRAVDVYGASWDIGDQSVVTLHQSNAVTTGQVQWSVLRRSSVASASNDNAFWPVVAGKTYEFSYYAQTGSGAACDAVLHFYNNAGTLLVAVNNGSVNVGNASYGYDLSTYTRIVARGTAPAGSVKAILAIRKTNAGVDSWLMLTQVQFAETVPNATQSVAFTPPGTTIIDGASITTGTVVADKISVSTLSAINSNLGSITAGSLNINSRFVVAADGSVTISSATTGQRLVLTNSLLSVYDSAGTLRARFGIW